MDSNEICEDFHMVGTAGNEIGRFEWILVNIDTETGIFEEIFRDSL